MLISKLLSLFVAGGYQIAALNTGGDEALLRTALFLIVPLSCIWFSEALGAFTGVTSRGAINRTTPGCFVALGGWLLLLLPLFGALIYPHL